MYKALIADDEQMIREGIAKLLAADGQFTVVAQAEDGEMALEQAKEHQPDFLFVDINMPFLNGLEFIEALEEARSDAIVIVITGYDDFAYAQKALQLGVFEYLLKPVMEKPFFECLEKAKQRMDSRRQRDKYMDWAKKQLERNRPTLATNFLSSWLHGALSEDEVRQQTEYLGISLPSPLSLTLVRLTQESCRSVLHFGWDENLLYYAVENMACELFAAHGPVTAFRQPGGVLVLLAAGTDTEGLRHCGQALVAAAREHLEVNLDLAQQVAAGRQAAPALYEDMMGQLLQEEYYSKTVQDAVRHIEDSFSDSGLSLAGTAGMLHISPQHLSRLFRHETGITFVDFLTRVRVRRAIELLERRDLKMYEIAERVGYSSQHYFSSAFKKVLGVSPQQFRQGQTDKRSGGDGA